MRLANILLMTAVANVLTTVHAHLATTENDQSSVSKAASPDQFLNVADAGADSKRSLRTVLNVDTGAKEEERGVWSSLVSRLPGMSAYKLKAENAKMMKLAPTHAKYSRNGWEPLNVYTSKIALGWSEKKAFRYGLRYEAFLKSLV